MLFCTKCGKPYVEVARNTDGVWQESPQPAPTAKKKLNIWLILLVVLGVIVAWSWCSNFFAFDPTANYENDYNEGVSCYNRSNYTLARGYFNKVGEDYKSTHIYNILCEGHIRHDLSDEQINELKLNLDFADTKSLLLSHSPIAERFLLGYWTTENDKTIFEVYLQGDYCGVSTNIAHSSKWDKADSFYIKDGVFGLYIPKDGDSSREDDDPLGLITDADDDYDKEDLFRISILGKNKIAIVVLKDNERFILERE